MLDFRTWDMLLRRLWLTLKCEAKLSSSKASGWMSFIPGGGGGVIGGNGVRDGMEVYRYEGLWLDVLHTRDGIDEIGESVTHTLVRDVQQDVVGS